MSALPSEPAPPPAPVRPTVSVGWVAAGTFDPEDLAAIRAAHRQFQEEAEEALPGFAWSMPLIEQPGIKYGARVEVADLLTVGVAERDARHLDFVFVVTSGDLIARYRENARGALSSAFGVAVLSTARIDPDARAAGLSTDARRQRMTQSLVTLARHAFGLLLGIERDPVESGLPARDPWSDEERALLRENLTDVADPRLEEGPRHTALVFWLSSVARNLRPILLALRRSRFWSFPFQLTKLMTAAVSTLVVLVFTAEVWDLALSHSPAHTGWLTAVVLLGTTVFVLRRQRLVVGARALTEQTVVTRVSVTLVVALGLLVTWAMLFVAGAVTTWLLFPAHLIEAWAPSAVDSVLSAPVRAALFTASFGITIGALGAAFEERDHLQHVAYVDEEF